VSKRAPTHGSVAGQTYLALRQKARMERRTTDELLQLHALEAFIDRLSTAERGRGLVLKGGALLAAYDVRRPTRDVDLSAQHLDNAPDHIREVVEAIIAEPRVDGWSYETSSAESIREDDHYSGVRVTVLGQLATARVTFHVDVSVGDVVWPAPTSVTVPRLLGGHLAVRAYPMLMIIAEKLVTALQRGTANTRWRDFGDVYLLTGKHVLHANEISQAIHRVAAHRAASLAPLSSVLKGFETIAATRWSAWVRKQGLDVRLPLAFAVVLDAVTNFADPLVSADIAGEWDPTARTWSSR
jgi:Nucleotidyl transferase AbiEii toxin, Type IV TA system